MTSVAQPMMQPPQAAAVVQGEVVGAVPMAQPVKSGTGWGF